MQRWHVGFTMVPLKPYSGLKCGLGKVFISADFYIVSYKQERPQMKIHSLNKQKHAYIIHTWSDKAFKETDENGALPFFNGESILTMLTVPLMV